MKVITSAASAAALLVCSATASFAEGNCQPCKVTMVGSGPYYDAFCSSGSCVFIGVSQVPTGKPACAVGSSPASWFFALDTSTAAGKTTYALVLSAYSGGFTVNIGGTNTCTVSTTAGVENLAYLALLP